MRSGLKKIVAGVVISAVAVGAGIAVWQVFRSAPVDAAGHDTAYAPLAASATSRVVTARGRLEPKNRVIKVAGPAQPAMFVKVLSQLAVKEGDHVAAGEVIGVFDNYMVKEAAVARLQAQLVEEERQFRRFQRLYKQGVAAAEERDAQETKRDVTRAALREAEAEFELERVRAPISGKVLKIRAYPGEAVGADGVCEIGQTDEMYAVAEVYENDIGYVRVGQRATAISPALDGEARGTVEEIGWKIGKMDVLSTDPAAKTDARVVEVRIKLDDSQRVEHLTNLQVDVRIGP